MSWVFAKMENDTCLVERGVNPPLHIEVYFPVRGVEICLLLYVYPPQTHTDL